MFEMKKKKKDRRKKEITFIWLSAVFQKETFVLEGEVMRKVGEREMGWRGA